GPLAAIPATGATVIARVHHDRRAQGSIRPRPRAARPVERRHATHDRSTPGSRWMAKAACRPPGLPRVGCRLAHDATRLVSYPCAPRTRIRQPQRRRPTHAALYGTRPEDTTRGRRVSRG